MVNDDRRKRDKDAQFEAEALRWMPDVTRYALSLARDEADADDLVQETYLRAYGSWGSYVPGTECRAWLFTICRNVFLRGHERARRQVSYDDPDSEALAAAAVHAAAQQSGYDDVFGRVDLSDALDRAIAELPTVFRDVVILVDVQDQSYDAAAEIIGAPLGTIRSRLFRGRRLLQEQLLAYARDAGLVRTAGGPSQRGSE